MMNIGAKIHIKALQGKSVSAQQGHWQYASV
jgi:hypothetical protein